MTRQEFIHEVKTVLETGNFVFEADEKQGCFQFQVDLDNGLTVVRLLCEEAAFLLQVFAAHPVKAPKDKVPGLGLLLHKINTRLRIGSFQFHVEDRVISYRLTMPIRPEGDVKQQISESFGITFSTMDEYFAPLGLYCCSTEPAREFIAKVAPESDKPDCRSGTAAGRLELN